MALRRWGTGIDSSSKILESTSLDGMKSVARACMEGLGSPSASRIRLLAKHRFDFRVLIGSSGAVPISILVLKRHRRLLPEKFSSNNRFLSRNGRTCLI
ncbi:hypothetical protein OPV22_029821 [Ensete ventricosum]|uniref:Uncharacterized protein n=1 Tax=Ensete ventricosum TaxID=4639 RepID=A0AAV8Q837_ENSVE|nr:hypothetical protein OPV22_029821 [Ensete ventricosum]